MGFHFKYQQISGIICLILFLIPGIGQAQFYNNKAFATIDFNNTMQDWDGFGFNYVQACKTLDYEKNPQDLGGFSVLTRQQKQVIVDLIFGKEGLQPNVIKMFLDPLHLQKSGGAYDHETTTENMRYFVSEGLKHSEKWNYPVEIITTLYGPPAFMTKHNSPSTSVLDPKYKKEMSLYMIHWLKYLRKHDYPVTFLSIHNEGTDWLRFPMYNNYRDPVQLNRDYNQLWRPKAIADYMAFMKPLMIKEGVGDIGLTPGEPINLFRFYHFGIADEILKNEQALASIDLITSHGFGMGNSYGRGYANANNYGATMLKSKRPELKSWITSMGWEDMKIKFGASIYEHIYGNQVSSIIPWAGIQQSSQWGHVNKHSACAVKVFDDSTFQVKKGYYLYKQFTKAGRAGMKVVKTAINRPDVLVAAFAQNGTDNPDAFTVINLGETSRYTTDMIELVFMVNGNNLYTSFPVKDKVLGYEQLKKDQMDGVKFNVAATHDGYSMEFAFPWKTLGGKPKAQFNFDIFARDGRDMPHAKIGWLGENNNYSGEICLGEKNNNASVAIQPLKGNLEIDGRADEFWTTMKGLTIDNNQMPGTEPRISGHWKMTWDNDNLYILVDMVDPTNYLGRMIKFDITNTDYEKFIAYRTDELEENYKKVDEYKLKNGVLEFLSPNRSITTFIGVRE